MRLGGEHDVVPAALECLADDLFGLPARVGVGGVDEVDARVQRLVYDAGAVLVVGVAVATEHHRAQAVRADLDAGSAQRAVFHGSPRALAGTRRGALRLLKRSSVPVLTIRNIVPVSKGGHHGERWPGGWGASPARACRRAAQH